MIILVVKLRETEKKTGQNIRNLYNSVRQFSKVSSRVLEGEETEWERLEISSIKLEIPREHFMERWAQ